MAFYLVRAKPKKERLKTLKEEMKSGKISRMRPFGQALEHNGPALVDVVVNPQELLIPPTINLEQIRGFTLYMIKAVLNGRGDEIVDLAKTNLFR
jgi:pyruvate dehydrogenase (quinone)